MDQHSSNRKPVIIAGGTWSTNIGNAFFQCAGKYIMSQVSGDRRVEMLTDQPGYWTYGRKRAAKNSFRLLDYVDADYVVLHGSVLTYSFPELWAQSFQIYKERKIRVILLGVGQFDYSRRETDLCRGFLQEYPPYVLVSRDSVTYDNFKDVARWSYNGIDNAYFLPLAYPKMTLHYPEYIMLNFDKGPEPTLKMTDDNSCFSAEKRGYRSCRVPFDQMNLHIDFPPFRRMLSDWFGKYYGYLATVLGLKRTRSGHIGRYHLVRADHQCNPLYHRKLYYGPNAFAMDIPFGYMLLYANASLTLSDRIHACIVTMAYGGTSMLFSKSPRVEIIERVGGGSVLQKPTTIDLAALDVMCNQELSFLRAAIKEA